MKFSGLAATAAREKSVTILLPGGREAAVLMRATSALEDMVARQVALTNARARGVKEAVDGDAIYDASFWAAIVSVAYLDPDSPADSRSPFFDGGPSQVLERIPTEGIAYLFQLQQQWQEEVSPSYKALSPNALVGAIQAMARADGDVFFSRCSPSTQKSCSLFMAGLLVSSPDTSWLSGAPGKDSTSKEKSSAPKPPRLRRPPERRPRKTTDR